MFNNTSTNSTNRLKATFNANNPLATPPSSNPLTNNAHQNLGMRLTGLNQPQTMAGLLGNAAGFPMNQNRILKSPSTGIQSQNLASPQPRQQQLAAQQLSQQQSLSLLDPTLITLNQFNTDGIKDDVDFFDPMGLGMGSSEFDMLKLGIETSQLGPQDTTLLSPLSGSPPDPSDIAGSFRDDDFGSNSLESSPFGSVGPSFGHPNTGQMYSMSVPVKRTAGGLGQIDPNQVLGAHPSSLAVASKMDREASTAPSSSGRTSTAMDPDERRRKRRESHNAVERRRRDNINEKIQELSSLLPEFPSDAQSKPNKGVVLRRSVDYLRHMQVFAAKQMDRCMELETVVMKLMQEFNIPESALGLSFTLGSPIEIPPMQQQPSSASPHQHQIQLEVNTPDGNSTYMDQDN